MLSPISNRFKQELSQAKIRIVIVSIALTFLIVGEHLTSTILLATGYFVYGIINFIWVKKSDKPSSFRRALNIVGDITAIYLAIYISDVNVIIAYPALLWIILGNALRFGVKYLLFTLTVSEIALSSLLLTDSYWSKHTAIVYTLEISLVLLSMFGLSLIKIMHQTNKKLEQKVNQRIEEIEHLYLHDSLTGLKNRVALTTDLQNHNVSALILLDIDNFHNYNELYGMDIGNKVLQNISSYLKTSSLSQKYDLYRIYGDLFILRKLDELVEKSIIEDDIKQLLTLFQNYKITIDTLDDSLDIDITIGASLGDNNLLEMVEMALKYAKQHKKKYTIYTKKIDNTLYSQELLAWKYKIKKAIKTDNIIPVYQAIVDKNGDIVKYESLMRLREYDDISHKESLISPFFFLDIAIKSKIYPQLTQIMIEKTFKDMKEHGADFSINLTFEDMIDDEIVAILKEQIKRYDIGNQIIFEIVESENIDDFPYAKKFVQEFKAMGVRVAIDDFGTGYSNFTHIFELEPDSLKIDGSLIKNIEHDKKSYELVTSITYFSKSLGIQTIAEFVSNENIFKICKDLGIDQFQGYYFCEPIPYDKLLDYEKSYKSKIANTILKSTKNT